MGDPRGKAAGKSAWPQGLLARGSGIPTAGMPVPPGCDLHSHDKAGIALYLFEVTQDLAVFLCGFLPTRACHAGVLERKPQSDSF